MTIAENEIDDFYTFLEPRLQKDDPSTITSNDGTSLTHPTDSDKGTLFNYGTPPERKWIPTEAHWANVWNRPPRLDLKVLIVNYKFDGKEPYYIDMYGTAWQHAEPCNPPKWKGDNHGR